MPLPLSFPHRFLSWRVSGPCAGRSVVKIRTQTINNSMADVLAQLDSATVEIAGNSPIDFCCTFTMRPILHETFSVLNVFGGCFSSSNH